MHTQNDFKVTLRVGVRDEKTSKLLFPQEEFVCVVSPPRVEYPSRKALTERCEAMARESWSRELWRRIDNDFTMQRELDGIEWVTFTKTIKVIEKVKKTNGR